MHVVTAVVGFLIGILVSATLGALFLQLAIKLVAKFKLPYGSAFKISLLCSFATFAIGFFIGFMLGFMNTEIKAAANVLIMVIGFFIQTSFYSQFIKFPTGESLPFGKACVVSIVQIVLSVLVIGLLCLALIGLYKLRAAL